MTPENISITIRADVSEFNRSLARLRATLAGVTYRYATQQAEVTRLSRAVWPSLPLWKRVWLTYQRKGW